MTTISRDPHGKPLMLVRSSGGSAARSYSYNINQELCRSVEPETGGDAVQRPAGSGVAAWWLYQCPRGVRIVPDTFQ